MHISKLINSIGIITLTTILTQPVIIPIFLVKNIPNQQILAAENQKRTALIIGNSNYQEVEILRNPKNDANEMAKTLKELGFDVILVKDASLKSMNKALEQFHQKLKKGGVGLFFYAGHGLQVEGENYLIPVDAKLATKGDVNYETVPLGKILSTMEDAGNDANIIILDACRNNPFKGRSWNRSLNSRGLAQVIAPKGSYISYATAPGSVAGDGDGKNGIFTSHLLKHIKTPNLSIEELLKKVRQGVTKETGQKQIPWDSSSLVGEFSFNPSKTPVTQTTPKTPVKPNPPSNNPTRNVPSPVSVNPQTILDNLKEVNINYSVSEESIKEWLANSDNRYSNVAKESLNLLKNNRLKNNGAFLDVIFWYYKEIVVGGGDLPLDSEINPEKLKEAIIKAYNARNGTNYQSFEEIIITN